MKKNYLLLTEFHPQHFRDAPLLPAGTILSWQRSGSYWQAQQPNGEIYPCRFYSDKEFDEAHKEEIATEAFAQPATTIAQ